MRRSAQLVAVLTLLAGGIVLAPLPAQTPRSAAVQLTLPSGVSGARQPQLAVTDDGTVHVAVAAGEAIYHAASRDGGRSFSAATKAADLTGLMAGKRRGPRIVANADAVVISAISKAGNLVAWRSSDSGSTWQRPVNVNDADKSAREGLHGMAIGPKGDVTCVWLDLRSGKSEVATSTSHDGGATWDANVIVYSSPDGHVCECCHPSVVYDEKGAVLVMWRNWLGGNRDMFLASSTDGGRTFSGAQKLGTESWKLNACPMDGGGLVAVSPLKAATTWRREKEVYVTSPGSPQERRLGAGEQPVIAAANGQAFVAWVSRRGEDLLLWKSGSGARTQPEKLGDTANDPALAGAPSGKGPLVVAWESGSGPNMGIRVMQVPTAAR